MLVGVVDAAFHFQSQLRYYFVESAPTEAVPQSSVASDDVVKGPKGTTNVDRQLGMLKLGAELTHPLVGNLATVFCPGGAVDEFLN